MFPNPFRTKPKRPYLKVCTKCHGKGQLSYFNAAVDKTYQSCDKCTTGNGFLGGLGVTLKCLCQEKSSRYDFLRVSELAHLKGLDRSVIKGLKAFQEELGPDRVAVCMMCDCGAQYLVEDVGARRRIAGERQHNEADKEHNKAIAEELAARGIARVLQPSRLHVAG